MFLCSLTLATWFSLLQDFIIYFCMYLSTIQLFRFNFTLENQEIISYYIISLLGKLIDMSRSGCLPNQLVRRYSLITFSTCLTLSILPFHLHFNVFCNSDLYIFVDYPDSLCHTGQNMSFLSQLSLYCQYQIGMLPVLEIVPFKGRD